jgi:2-oxoglutarate ferredoxin oxidoreductase subunit alpha
LADGALGQMMEKVILPEEGSLPRHEHKWATTGKLPNRERNIITSLFIQPEKMETINIVLQEKYRKMQAEIRFEKTGTDDAEILLTGFGLAARVCQKAIELAREKGIKAGLLRPITLYPFPYNEISNIAQNVESVIVVEMNSGQMVEDVKLAVNGKCPVEFTGRMGGMIPSPEDVLGKIIEVSDKQSLINK